jgi:predicted aspartyl protease
LASPDFSNDDQYAAPTLSIPSVLVRRLEEQYKTSLLHPHSIAAIIPKVVFISPPRFQKTFPTIKIEITDQNQNTYAVEALLDSGATALYIHSNFMKDHSLPYRKLRDAQFVKNADNTLNSTLITQETLLTAKIGSHQSSEWYFVTDLGDKPIVIGMTWLRSHNPEIDWKTGEIKFTRCPAECSNFKPKKYIQNLHDYASTLTEYTNSINELFTAPQHQKPLKHAATQWAIEAFKTKKVHTLEDIKAGPFAEFADVFEEKMYNDLPPHRPWDHKIELVDDWETRKWKPRTYPLSYDEQQELDKFLEENLKNGRIRPSESPLASPVFFIKKKNGDRRLIVDYRRLNEITVKNSYPLPRIDELIQKWQGCKYFTALDIRSGYYNIRMREGDEWKTAFTTNRGLFEFLVMAFGKCNAPATFQTMMDSIFVVQIRRGDTNAYIDDIGIATKSDPTGQLSDEDFAIKVVKEVLQICRENKLSLKPEKCHFLQDEIPYLGHYISGKGIRPDPVKLSGIKDWPVPTNVSELRSYLGVVGYYRRYMRDFAQTARPLNDLLRKGKVFEWNQEQQIAFQTLKDILLKDVVLLHPNIEKDFILETDASLFAWGAVLSQQDHDGHWKPIGCISKSFAKAEMNYDTHDRELLAIVRALETFRHWLVGTKTPFIILTDHNNLRYFTTKQFLTDRQTRWAKYLADFDFILRYRPGRQCDVPDKLSRRADHEKAIPEKEPEVLLPLGKFEDQQINRMDQTPLLDFADSDLGKEIFIAQSQDPLILDFNTRNESNPLPMHWKRTEDFWTYRNKIYIPSILRQTIFRTLHDHQAHPGQDNTLYNIRRDYYWPNLTQEVETWVQQCDACQRHKNRTRPKHGYLQPIDPVPRFWGVVTMDLITGLPSCKGYDAIWTATDKRGKMKHIAATKTTLDSKGLWTLIVENIWKHHGTMDKIITDRGPQMSSQYTKDMAKKFGIQVALSTAYRPQTDGQSERTNQEVEQALRTVVSYHQDDWVDWIPIIEFALNNRYHKGLKTTPFYANYGYHPQIGSLPHVETPIQSIEDFVEHLHQVQKNTEKSLLQAAEDMKRFYDKHHGATPDYQIGQKVLLDNADLALNRPSRKLTEKRSGPFKIIEKIGGLAYKLELPSNWKNIHPVFHVSKLEAYREDPKSPNFTQPPPDLNEEGEPEWEVEEILDSQFHHGKLRYLVKWLGYSNDHNSWQSEKDLIHAQEVIQEFYKKHPGAPRRLPGGKSQGTSLLPGRKRGRKKIGCIEAVELENLADISEWKEGKMSRDATF